MNRIFKFLLQKVCRLKSFWYAFLKSLHGIFFERNILNSEVKKNVPTNQAI